LTEDPYFAMPASALIHLREELQIMMGDQYSKEALYRYGQRCGEALVEKVGIKCTAEELKGLFNDLWFEVGLGRPSLDKSTDDEIVVMFEESIEVSPKNSCDYTRGYLAGVVSAILGRRYAAIETTCISDGAPCCTHVLKPSTVGLIEAEPVSAPEKPRFRLDGGLTYLVKEETTKLSYEVAADAARHGWRVLCITREYPEDVKRKFKLDRAAFFWLTMDESTEYAMPPTDLARIYTYSKTFLTEGEKGFILLSGVEYLISQNSYGNVLKFVQLMNDKVAVNRSVMLVSVSPLALEPKELKMLEKETHRPPFESEMDDLLGR
jgi:predicted hydrocarbon binding protein